MTTFAQRQASNGEVDWILPIAVSKNRSERNYYSGLKFEGALCHYDEVNHFIYIAGNFPDSLLVKNSIIRETKNASLSNNRNSGISSDIFILKIDTSGQAIWKKRYGSPDFFNDYGEPVKCERLYSIDTDNAGNLHLCGMVRGKDNVVNFESFNFKSPQDGYFYLKIDSDGKESMIRFIDFFQKNNSHECINMALDANAKGDVIISAALCNMGTPVIQALRKITSDGELGWIKYIFGEEDEMLDNMFKKVLIEDLKLSNDGSVFLAGTSNADTLYFGMEEEKYLLSIRHLRDIYFGKSTQEDIFFAKLSDLGEFEWGKYLGSRGSDNAFGIELDKYSEPILYGYVSATENSPAISIDDTIAYGNLFYQKYSTKGEKIWSTTLNPQTLPSYEWSQEILQIQTITSKERGIYFSLMSKNDNYLLETELYGPLVYNISSVGKIRLIAKLNRVNNEEYYGVDFIGIINDKEYICVGGYQTEKVTKKIGSAQIPLLPPPRHMFKGLMTLKLKIN